MKFAFIHEKQVAFPVGAMCRALAVSSSGYYEWRKRLPGPRTKDDAQLAVEIAAVHKRSRSTYGSPRVHAELRAGGTRVGRKRVERLMRENGIQARRKRRFCHTTDSKHPDPIAPNVLARRFSPTAPNRVWVTDVTYVWTEEGWLYLAVMLDLFARRVVGWAASAPPRHPAGAGGLGAALRLRHRLQGSFTIRIAAALTRARTTVGRWQLVASSRA